MDLSIRRLIGPGFGFFPLLCHGILAPGTLFAFHNLYLSRFYRVHHVPTDWVFLSDCHDSDGTPLYAAGLHPRGSTECRGG